MNNDRKRYEDISKIINHIINTNKIRNENACVCCGASIPEGRQVCYKCERR